MTTTGPPRALSTLEPTIRNMAVAQGNTVREEVVSRSLDELETVRHLPTTDALAKMRGFAQRGEEASISDIERITFVELLDIIEREGKQL